jgi:hypothetical protein
MFLDEDNTMDNAQQHNIWTKFFFRHVSFSSVYVDLHFCVHFTTVKLTWWMALHSVGVVKWLMAFPILCWRLSVIINHIDSVKFMVKTDYSREYNIRYFSFV